MCNSVHPKNKQVDIGLGNLIFQIFRTQCDCTLPLISSLNPVIVFVLFRYNADEHLRPLASIHALTTDENDPGGLYWQKVDRTDAVATKSSSLSKGLTYQTGLL